jgi:hypothetical protein
MTLTPEQIERVNREVFRIAWPDRKWLSPSDNPYCEVCYSTDSRSNPDPLHDLNDAWAALMATCPAGSINGGPYRGGNFLCMTNCANGIEYPFALGATPCHAICRAILATVGKTLEGVAGG